MRKKYKRIILLIFFSFFLTNFSFANQLRDTTYACNLFYEKIKNSEDRMARNYYVYYDEDGFGFLPAATFDEKKNEWRFLTEGKKIFVNHTTDETGKIRSGTVILKINGEDAANIVNNGWYDYIDREDIQTLELEIVNLDNKKETIILEKKRRDWGVLYHFIRSLKITDIDIKKSTYSLTIENVYEDRYDFKDYFSDEYHIINQTALETLFVNDENGTLAHICNPDANLFNNVLIDPATIEYPDVVEKDLDLETNLNKIWVFAKEEGYEDDETYIQRSFKNNFKVSNNFNLRSFPFDKQNLKFRIVDRVYTVDERIFEISPFSFRVINDFLTKDDIPGWNKISAKISNIEIEKITNKDIFWSGLEINISLERKHGYYIFKVILPILLILSVCWSVVWVDPKELEARLTITIVCLLSLIAYNFVIDAELPKLEYLTVLDWIVLISYVYATIPNFLSIISFRLQKTNILLSNKIEFISKRYGLSSYVLGIFVIVWINAFSNPENSSSLISWLAPR